MQPDLRKLICEHIIRVLHQKDVNQKQYICVKHDFVAFVDDIDIIAGTCSALRQAFLSLEKEALRMGLEINESKTKYMS
ncbi:hypothetical protein TNCV_5033071 [Trichonephila clavipes]|nr:hypothetical protein TNCV_5033071 [Trichonephila clavipes]